LIALHSCVLIVVVLLLGSRSVFADTTVINLEGLSDGTILTNQYPGLSFSDAIVLTAGISLNEFEFPPHSGVNVVLDNGGPMSIDFANPVLNFAGYFTYAMPLSIVGFGPSNNQVATATSAFSNNEALSGVAGSNPNEFLSLTGSSGISRIQITGDPAGSSFTLDDLTFGTTPVPEPSTILLVLASLVSGLPLRIWKSKRAEVAP